MKTTHVTIAKVDGPVFDDVAISVTVPGTEGEMTILATHEPLISPLRAGTIVVKRESGEIESFEIKSGTLEVSHSRIALLI